MHVRVPATSANLGPGFDALGLALDLWDDIRVQADPAAADGRVAVSVRGEGEGEVPVDESHLVVRSLLHTLERMQAVRPGLMLSCENRIPHARGLGSSAAAIVAGVLAARALAVTPLPEWDTAWVLRLAAEIEGHPDNVAACVHGGLTVAWTAPGGAQALRLEPHESVTARVLVPDLKVSTEKVRGLLPTTVPMVDAVHNLGRTGLLVGAMVAGRTELLLEATSDRLHQDYRADAMPEASRIVRSLRQRGIAAAISGAGPTVLTLPTSENDLRAVTAAAPPGWSSPDVTVSVRGGVADRPGG